MRSVRLGDHLERKLEDLAQVTGQPVSEIIREAVSRHCDQLTVDRLSERMSDVVGAVSSGGGNSRKTGRAFTAVARKKEAARRSRTK